MKKVSRESDRIFPEVPQWCLFDDSWSQSSVQSILRELDISEAEVVWDPFCGAGTTGLAATQLGLRSELSDVNPMAALVAEIQTNIPARSVLESVAWTTEDSIQTLFKLLSKKSPDSDSLVCKVMRFLLIAAFVRSGWHLGAPFREEWVRGIYESIRKDMANYSKSARRLAKVGHRDYADVQAVADRYPTASFVLVTSPPFYGSNVNPNLVKLGRAIGVDIDDCKATIDPKVYDNLLNSIADVANELSCRAVAVELSSAGRGIGYKTFVERLTFLGYHISVQAFELDRSDPSVLCVGLKSV